MIPADFPEANVTWQRPSDLEESQCRDVRGYQGQVVGGTLDGARVGVVAWRPTPEQLEDLQAGQPIFVTMVGGVAPHYLSTSFVEATHPA